MGSDRDQGEEFGIIGLVIQLRQPQPLLSGMKTCTFILWLMYDHPAFEHGGRLTRRDFLPQIMRESRLGEEKEKGTR